MAKGLDAEIWEDDACLNCGATNFFESKTPGLCFECYVEMKEESHPHIASDSLLF
jgi:uncharacterized membrane protein